MRARGVVLPAALFACLASGCRTVTVEHQVKAPEPIYIKIDINVRIQKELDDFFSDLDAADPTLAPASEDKGKQP